MPASQGRHPCLPLSLLEQLKRDKDIPFKSSMIHDNRFTNYRFYAMRRATDPNRSEGGPLSLSHGDPPQAVMKQLLTGRECSYLHLAAITADVPLSYECIRLGVSIDTLDNKGDTPLLLACRMLAMLPRAGKRDAVSRRAVRIATTLVEQYADVNVVKDGRSPLTYACQALQWPLIELLLLHGARPSSRQPSGLSDGLSSQSDSSRFAALVKKIGPVSSRPPRPCPCWSGKPLSKCHAADQHLYPAHFFCPCGSRKSYGHCCSRREFQTYEAWHTGLERIEIRTERPSLDLPAVRVLAQIPDAKELSGTMYNFDGFMNLPPEYQEQNKRMRCAMADRLLALRAVDPGYAYAMKEVDFIPQYWGKSFSKVESGGRAREWNDAIDRYIALGQDSRPRLLIEFECKIASDGGPLYKSCEATDCYRHEGMDMVKLKWCSRCQKTYYCSENCQKASWKEHRKSCGKADQKAQILLSQEEHQRYLDAIRPEFLKLCEALDAGVPLGEYLEFLESP